ncbi:flippase-like domain-containing protein [Candidatus Daviesbacteria bacterium]|nr:flippase-like domain-containing protein [Candidatus Daviesbacteria bacterium]
MLSFKAFLRILINSLVGVVLVLIWLKFVNLSELLKVLKTTDLKYIFGVLAFFAISSVLRSIRLKILLNSISIPLKNLIFLSFLSQLLSFIIPLRVGEISKSVYLSTQYSLPLTKSVIWILLDRFLDFWGNLMLISILILFVAIKLPSNFQLIVFLVLLIFTILTILMIKSIFLSKKILEFFSSFLFFPKLKRTFLNTTLTVIEGFEILDRHPLELLQLILISLLALFSDAFIWFFIFASLNINLGLAKTLLGSLISALTFLIPSAPGYIGSAEAAGLAVFGGILGLNPNLASAVAVLNHLLTTIAILISGLASLYFLKFDLNLVFKKVFRKA